jgi:hypothetical protein
VKKALRQGNSMKVDFIERPSFLPAGKKPLSTDRALNATGLCRDLVNVRELNASETGGNFALNSLCGWNQVKVSTDDHGEGKFLRA